MAQGVAIGDLNQQVESKSNDEIKDVIDTVNIMTKNLRATAVLADAVADGDLTVQPKPLSDKDTLGLALERMVDRLRGVVADAISASENVSAGSQQLSSASEQVSQGATEQASSAEEPRPPWRKWPPTSNRTPTTPARPRRSPVSPPRTRSSRVRPWPRRWRRCAPSPRRSPSCRRSRARPTCWP
ncbi:methyl-accepting chemotaxis protein [Phenylobacterium aquaticum]|nr:methyl-accepting chemotaxis protein [Phenylobacterium aquaticum]